MKNIITNLNKTFDHRIRLGIMSILLVSDWVDFNTLKQILEVTDGNLASHLKALEAEEYITIRKQFIGRRPNTSYQVTPRGKQSFNDHLNALEELLNMRT
ncbi:MAG: transcriptional regulator [Saprospiraceae bacterium]